MLGPLSLLLLPLAATPAPLQGSGSICPEATLLDPVPTPEARLGFSVAVSGDDVAVGAPFATGSAVLSGAVRLFERTAAGWVPGTQISGADCVLGDGFGSEIALDGDRMVVGAVWKDGPGVDSGAAYVFERNGGGIWMQTEKLVPSDPAALDWFGRTVDVDGDRIAVGASRKADPAPSQGAVYVFERQGSQWNQTAKIKASDGAGDDYFGGAIDLDGDRLLVGAHGGDDLASESGGAYVFDLIGGTWVESAKLIAADGRANDDLGIEVALSGDVAALASYGDDDAGTDAGAAYVFTRDPGGVWHETQQLFASNAAPGDGLGSGIAMDGDVLVVGAQDAGPGGAKNGAAYAFRRDPSTGLFAEEARLGGAPPQSFLGFDVAVAGDLLVAGAPESNAVASNGGEVRTARLGGGSDLFGCPAWLSVSKGGVQTLTVTAGPAFAFQSYFIAGSASGTSPGLTVGGVAVPLNLDSYLLLTIEKANIAPFQATFGVLNGSGKAVGLIALPPGSPAALAGTSLVHASLMLDPVLLTPLASTSAAPLVLLP